MAILQLLPQLLTTKATAVIAALALVGGGAALASEAADESAGDDALITATDADEQLEPSSDALSEEHPDGTAEDEAEDEAEAETEDEAEAETEDEAEAETEELVADAEEEDTRSETAVRVHRALTGDDTLPGDPEFGKKVSARARMGQPGDLGDLISRAARNEDFEEDLELEKREPRAPTEEPEAGDVSTADEAEASGGPEQAGPPEGTPAADRGKGRGGR